MKEEAYRVLNLPFGASKNEIRKAYRRLAMQMHPDRNASKEAENKFIELSEAYEILMDEGKIYKPKPQPWQAKPKTVHEIRIEEILQRRERARQYAQMRYEDFLRENEAFRQSKWFGPAKIFYTIILIAHFLVGLTFVAIPIIMYLRFESFRLTLLFSPTILIGAIIFAAAIDFYRQMQETFYKSS